MAAELKPLTYDELKAIADQQSARMHEATSKLNLVATELPTYKLAQMYVELRNEQEGKPPFIFNATEVIKIAKQISAMEQQGKHTHVEILFYQYMNLLPVDPFEALIVDWEITKAYWE